MRGWYLILWFSGHFEVSPKHDAPKKVNLKRTPPGQLPRHAPTFVTYLLNHLPCVFTDIKKRRGKEPSPVLRFSVGWLGICYDTVDTDFSCSTSCKRCAKRMHVPVMHSTKEDYIRYFYEQARASFATREDVARRISEFCDLLKRNVFALVAATILAKIVQRSRPFTPVYLHGVHSGAGKIVSKSYSFLSRNLTYMLRKMCFYDGNIATQPSWKDVIFCSKQLVVIGSLERYRELIEIKLATPRHNTWEKVNMTKTIVCLTY